MPDEALDRFELQLVHIANGDLSFRWEGPASTVHGTARFISIQWMVAPGDEENLHRVRVAMSDITDRLAAENSLRDSEARMRALFAAMNDIIVILDRGGRCIEAVLHRGIAAVPTGPYRRQERQRRILSSGRRDSSCPDPEGTR